MKHTPILIILKLILILVLVYQKKLNYKVERFRNIRNNAVHTVFILKENITFLEEWIEYHKKIGFNKFYLYDNSGSIGRNSSTKSKTKYNFNIDKMIKLSDSEIQTHLDKILKKYPEITYVKWQPRDKKGNIVYGYMDSIYNYFKNYKNDNDWTAFIDIDEFIYVNYNNNINSFIDRLDKDISQISMHQKKMEDRFCSLKNNILEIENSLEVDTHKWGHKNIVKNSSINLDTFREENRNSNMHYIKTHTGERKLFSPEEIVFYHYNVNAKQIKWIQKNNKKFTKIKNKKLNNKDSSQIKNYHNDFIDSDYIKKHYQELCYF